MSVNYRFDKPDWDKWRMRDIARLWQAACLAADIEPPSPVGDEIWYEAQLKDFPASFQRVWEVLNWDKNFVKLPLQPYSGRMLHSIDLDGFSHWATEKGIELPSPLKDRAERYVSTHAVPATAVLSDDRSIQSGVTRHTLKTRINVLDPAINQAIRKTNSDAETVVFAELREMALEQVPPFNGDIDGESLMYTDGVNVKPFTQSMLGSRLTRRRKNAR